MKRNKKKFTYYLLILFSFAFTLTCNLEAATLTIGSGSGLPGAKNISIPINLTSAPSEKAGSFNLNLNFDISRLAFKTVALGPKAVEAGKSLSHSQPNPNIVRVIVIGFNQNVIGDGVVLNFTFDILDNAPPGKADLTITKPSVAEPDGKLLPVTVNNGSITVEGNNPGSTTSTTAPKTTTTSTLNTTTVKTNTSTTIPEPPPDSTTTTTDTVNSTTSTTINSVTSTTSLSSSTTTSTSEILWPLLYNETWKEKQEQNLFLLRSFRDEVLINTELGQEYLFMIYSNSLEILILLLQDPIAVKLASEVADGCLESIEFLLYRNEMVLNRETIDVFDALLTQLEPKASPNLKFAIEKVKKDIKDEHIIKKLGIKMIE